MNIFIIILLIIISLVALLLILALFVKKQYEICREIVIEQPGPVVFQYVKHLRNQDHYSKYVMEDPTMKKDFRGTDGIVGFVYAWEGNDQAGKGEQEIIRIKEDERIDMEMRFVKPFEGVAYTYMETTPVNGHKTKIRWAMKGLNPYPRNLMNLLLGSLLGKDMEISLANLKSILEKQETNR